MSIAQRTSCNTLSPSEHVGTISIQVHPASCYYSCTIAEHKPVNILFSRSTSCPFRMTEHSKRTRTWRKILCRTERVQAGREQFRSDLMFRTNRTGQIRRTEARRCPGGEEWLQQSVKFAGKPKQPPFGGPARKGHWSGESSAVHLIQRSLAQIYQLARSLFAPHAQISVAWSGAYPWQL